MKAPFEELPEKEKVKVERIILWLYKHANMVISMDDDYIRPLMTSLGIPGLEAIPLEGIEDGGGTSICFNDGKTAYAFGVWKNHADKKENGYAMIQMDAMILAKLTITEIWTPFEIAGAIHYLLGFDGTKARLSTMKIFDPAPLN